jgi:hypothetical protein
MFAPNPLNSMGVAHTADPVGFEGVFVTGDRSGQVSGLQTGRSGSIIPKTAENSGCTPRVAGGTRVARETDDLSGAPGRRKCCRAQLFTRRARSGAVRSPLRRCGVLRCASRRPSGTPTAARPARPQPCSRWMQQRWARDQLSAARSTALASAAPPRSRRPQPHQARRCHQPHRLVHRPPVSPLCGPDGVRKKNHRWRTSRSVPPACPLWGPSSSPLYSRAALRRPTTGRRAGGLRGTGARRALVGVAAVRRPSSQHGGGASSEALDPARNWACLAVALYLTSPPPHPRPAISQSTLTCWPAAACPA